jgi:hypothetical protein
MQCAAGDPVRTGKSGAEDEVLALGADTASYSGRLKDAREFSAGRWIPRGTVDGDRETRGVCFPIHSGRQPQTIDAFACGKLRSILPGFGPPMIEPGGTNTER